MHPAGETRQVRNPSAFGPPPIGPAPSWISGKFEDDIWTYVNEVGVARNLDFMDIPKSFRLTCKMFLWALEYVDDPRISRVPVQAPSSFNTYIADFRYVANVCARRGVNRLLDLSADDVASIFCERIKLAAPGGTISAGTYGCLRQSYRKMHLFGPGGFAVIPDGLCVEPPDKLLPMDVEIVANENTPLMPENVAVSLLNAAIEYVEHGDDIVLLAGIAKKVLEEASNRNIRIDRSKEVQRLGLEIIERDGLKAQVEAAVARLQPLAALCEPEVRRLTSFPPPPGYAQSLDLLASRRTQTLVRHAYAASFCVIAGFTGFRASEILSMQKGDVFTSGARTIIRTKITKPTGSSAGVRVDRTCPPILKTAFDLMKKLAELYSRNDDLIWLTEYNKPYSTLNMNKAIKRFIIQHVKIEDWNLTTHQFRRYFAVFFIRRFQGADDALRRHFRHVSYQMIETYIRDPMGLKFFLEANKSFTSEVMHKLVEGTGEYTSRHKGIVHHAIADYRAKNLPPSVISKLLAKLIDEHYQEIRPTYWGYCILQKGQSEGAVCAKRDGIPDAREMFPMNCGRCKYLVVGREQLDHWRYTKKMHQEVADAKDTTELLRVAALQAVAVADEVLQRV